jgi:gluconokinase
MTVVVMMGVSGSGKTTIAGELGKRTGWILLEGDGFHPPENIAKMQAGVPLTDEDRWPWLRAIAAAVDASRVRGESAIVACSALKRAYRDILIGGRPDVVLVYLQGSYELIRQRMAARHGHFMPPALLDSQFVALEEPTPDEHAIIVQVGQTPNAIVDEIMHQLRKRAS